MLPDPCREQVSPKVPLEPLGSLSYLISDEVLGEDPTDVLYLRVSREFYKFIVPQVYRHLHLHTGNVFSVLYPLDDSLVKRSLDGERKAKALKNVKVVTLEEFFSAARIAWWSEQWSFQVNPHWRDAVPRSPVRAFPAIEHVHLGENFINPDITPKWDAIIDHTFTRQLPSPSFCNDVPIDKSDHPDFYFDHSIYLDQYKSLIRLLASRQNIRLRRFTFHVRLTKDLNGYQPYLFNLDNDKVVPIWYIFEVEEEEKYSTIDLMDRIFKHFLQYPKIHQLNNRIKLILPDRPDLESSLTQLGQRQGDHNRAIFQTFRNHVLPLTADRVCPCKSPAMPRNPKKAPPKHIHRCMFDNEDKGDSHGYGNEFGAGVYFTDDSQPVVSYASSWGGGRTGATFGGFGGGYGFMGMRGGFGGGFN